MRKKRLAWCTDVHFDCAGGDAGVAALAAQVKAVNADGLLLTGDISTGPKITGHLTALDRELRLPVYFVAGNHDFYGTSVAAGRQQLKGLCEIVPGLRYMSVLPYMTIGSDTALVGHDGWYDALNGDWRMTNFLMNDWRKIQEFADVAPWNPATIDLLGGRPSMASIVGVARKLSYEAALHVAACIAAAARSHRSIVVITHVPPWENVTLHTRPGYTSWYTSKLMGDTLAVAAKKLSRHTFTVLCGHTHSRWSGKLASNMHVHVGGAKYGAPEVQPVILEVD